MAILLQNEVNISEINKRFEEMSGRHHEVELGYPNINDKWTLENERKVHTEDWKIITEQIKEDYKEIDYDLILASAHCADKVFRTASCFTCYYKLK